MPETEPEPRALTYKEVERAFDGEGSPALEAWRKICDIVGSGQVLPSETATIALTGVAPGKIKRVEAILAKAEEAESTEEATKADKKAEKTTAPANPPAKPPAGGTE